MWEKILIEGRLHRRSHNIPLTQFNHACCYHSLHRAIQERSFPIVNPLNQTFPDNTYRGDPDLDIYEIPEDAKIMLQVTNPKPGYWFMVAYLPRDDDDRIKQEV